MVIHHIYTSLLVTGAMEMHSVLQVLCLAKASTQSRAGKGFIIVEANAAMRKVQLRCCSPLARLQKIQMFECRDWTQYTYSSWLGMF